MRWDEIIHKQVVRPYSIFESEYMKYVIFEPRIKDLHWRVHTVSNVSIVYFESEYMKYSFELRVVKTFEKSSPPVKKIYGCKGF